MLKRFYSFLSGVFWSIIARAVTLRMKGEPRADAINPMTPSIVVEPAAYEVRVPSGPFDIAIVYEDKELSRSLGALHNNDIAIARSIMDIN